MEESEVVNFIVNKVIALTELKKPENVFMVAASTKTMNLHQQPTMTSAVP
jgi:hypothetical protein